MNFNCSEKYFDAIMNNIKAENDLIFHDESSDLVDSASIAHKSIENKNKKLQQDEMCELASTSYEKDVNIFKSNSQEPTDTKLVDGKIVSTHTSSPSTALPIKKILSPKSGPHTCLECCFKCNMVFRVLDSPLHIQRIRSIDKQNEFLKIEPSLCVDSCLCDICWKYLEKTYKSNKCKNKKKELYYSKKKSKLFERYGKNNVSKNQNQERRCSIHLCSQPSCHKLSVNECKNIKTLFLIFESHGLVLAKSTKQTTDFLKCPLGLCKIHNSMFMIMSTCQICGDKLNAPFNTDDWLMHEMWNIVLIENNLPLILKPGMFICVTCKGYIFITNPGFPTIDLPRLRKYILSSNAFRLKLYEEPQYNLFNICQGSTYVSSLIVDPKIVEEKECVSSTKSKFSDPVITTNNHCEVYYDKKEPESITNTALINVAKQNRCVPKLEPKDEGLNFIAAVEPLNDKVNPVSIKRKQSDVICDTIYSKDVKKQRMNEINCSYENNSTDVNTTKSYRNKNIALPIINSPSILIMTSNCKNKYDLNSDVSDFAGSSDSEMFSETDSEQILPDYKIKETDYIVVGSDANLSLDSDRELVKSELEIKSDHKTEMDCKFVSDNKKSLDGKIIFNGENVLENYTTLLASVKDSNCEMVPDAETESDNDEQSYINISVTEKEFNNKKLSTFKMVSNVQKGSDHEILLDYNKVFDTASWSEKGPIKYTIIFDDEIKLSGNNRSTCRIISNNDEEFNNKLLSTYKIILQIRSNIKILLKGKKIEIISESESRKVKYKIGSFDNKKSKCIIIFDDEKEFINKNLSTFKIVSYVKKGSDCEILLDGKKVYDIKSESKNGKIKYMIVSKDEIKSTGNKGSQCTIIPDNEEKFNNKKSTFKILVKNVNKGSHSVLLDGEKFLEMLSKNKNGRIKCIIASDYEEKVKYTNILDNTITSNNKIIFNDSQSLKILDYINTIYNIKINNDSQSHIKYKYTFPYLELTFNEDGDAKQDKIQEFYLAIRYYFENTENQSFKKLYSQINNVADMLLYLTENLRMLYNEELVISKTADEFSKDFLKEQKITLYSYFGDLKNNINASKPFIHPLSHLHQYIKRLLSDYIELCLIFKDVTTTISSSIQINSIDSPKKNVAANKGVGSKFNNIKSTKLLAFCNLVSKLRNNIISINRIFKVPKHLLTYKKPLLTRRIPYLPDDNQTYTRLIIQHPTKYNIQFPVAIKKKTVSKSKVLSLPICKLKK